MNNINAQNGPVSSTDSLADQGELRNSQAATANEEIFLNHTFGVMVPARGIMQNEIENFSTSTADRVAASFYRNIDITRHQLEESDLADLLDVEIRTALRSGSRQDSPTSTSRLRAVMDSQRAQQVAAISSALQKVPPALMNDYLRYSTPVALDITPGVDSHHLTVDLPIRGKTRTVSIDTRHKFWRTEGPFENANAMRDALIDKGIVDAGISLQPSDGLPQNVKILLADAQQIANANYAVILTTNKYIPVEGEVNGNEFRINTNSIVSHRCDQPPGFAGLLVGSLTGPQLEAFLSYSVGDTFPNWNILVQGLDVDPNDAFPGGGGATYAEEMAARIFAQVGNGTFTSPLASSNAVPLHVIQNDLQEQHKYTELLRDGSDNAMAAAYATMILMKYKDKELREGIGGSDLSEIDTRILSYRNRQYLVGALAGLSGMETPSSCMDYNEVVTKIGEITAAPMTPGSTVVLMAGSGPPITETFALASGKGFKASVDRLNQRLAALQKEKREFEKIEQGLISIKNKILVSGMTVPPAISDFFTALGNPLATPPVPHTFDYSKLDKSIDLKIVSEIAKNSLSDLKGSADEYEVDIKKLQSERKEKEKGGLTGEAAQHKVISTYLELYQGLSPREATETTNVIRSRALLDGEMSMAIRDKARDKFGDLDEGEGEELSGATGRIIESVARYSRVPLSGGVPQWNSAGYEQLCTAYFALRKLTEGEGPSRMHLDTGNAQFKFNMNKIFDQLARKNATALLWSYDSSTLDLSDEDKKRVASNPTKAENLQILSRILDGPPPAQFEGRIQDIIHSADIRARPVRRRLDAALGMSGNATKNLLYKNRNWSALGLARNTKNHVGARKKAMLYAGLFGMMLGPAGVAAGVGLAAAFGPKSQGSSDSFTGGPDKPPPPPYVPNQLPD